MHIKVNKKKGFILAEVLVLSSILILIISFYTKNTIWSIKKSPLYFISEDILTMNEDEYEFLDEVIENIKKEPDLIESIKNTDKFKSVEYEFSSENLCFKIFDGNIYMIESNEDSTLYRKMELIFQKDNLRIIPKYYKGYNINI